MKQEKLFKVLDFWNYWNRELNTSYDRKKYLDKINLFKKSSENIILKWIRRSWKSTILNLEIKKLLKSWVNKENILFINFEEPKFFWKLNLDLLEQIWETYNYYLEPDLTQKIYVFLDEIQNMEAWEKWVLKFYEMEDIQFFITWSSSKLLSKEFSTALAWRHLFINILPLSFGEFLIFKNLDYEKKIDFIRNENKIKKYFEEYIKFWWFPKITLLWDEKLKKEELTSYFDTIIIKDIAKRYNIWNIEVLKKLAYFFLSNDTKLFSVNNLTKLDLWAYDTIKKYIDFFKETYLFFELSKFDYSFKKQLINPKKMYCSDLWFVNLLSFQFSENLWRILENLVFMELKRKWEDIFYHKWEKECDFIIKEKNKIIRAIQVTYSLEDLKTKEREINGLIDALKTYNLNEWLILTYDEDYEIIEKDELQKFKITVVSTYKWLLT